uniref:Uncharacterized protein n=1 Tax=Onchocerca volvulus TaxID=6282 RepID=A0A8R1Y1U4_ONCVO
MIARSITFFLHFNLSSESTQLRRKPDSMNKQRIGMFTYQSKSPTKITEVGMKWKILFLTSNLTDDVQMFIILSDIIRKIFKPCFDSDIPILLE